MQNRITLRNLFESNTVGQIVCVKGWIRSVRKSKSCSFIMLSDGSCQQNLQIVVDANLNGYKDISALLTGASVGIVGEVVASSGNQSIELLAKEVEIIGLADATYPLQKKGTSLEFLREQAHFRARTNLFGAIFRIRHHLAFATHKFFNDRGYFYLNSPIITGQDGEGAGEMFKVTTLDLNNVPKRPDGSIDYGRDYFGKETSLCVTGQLEGESHALGLGAIYTFGPTFRSENSNTSRHLSEFWMIEPEVAFFELEDVAQLAEDYIKFLIDYAIKLAPQELDFLFKYNNTPDHIKVLESVRDSKFIRITYTQAVEILSTCGRTFEYPTNWGAELQSEHERYLTEVHFKTPVIVTDYPKQCKAFYMKQNPDGKTVRAMDVLVPGVGEIIGGSQREADYDKLVGRMQELNMKVEDYWWYLELRKFGSVPHAGFGLGFERALLYITGMTNIRDVIPFPRTPKSAEF